MKNFKMSSLFFAISFTKIAICQAFFDKKKGGQKMTTLQIAICHGQSIHVSWDMKLFISPKF